MERRDGDGRYLESRIDMIQWMSGYREWKEDVEKEPEKEVKVWDGH